MRTTPALIVLPIAALLAAPGCSTKSTNESHRSGSGPVEPGEPGEPGDEPAPEPEPINHGEAAESARVNLRRNIEGFDETFSFIESSELLPELFERLGPTASSDSAEPTDPEGGVARFIAKRGEGLHHVCFEVDGLQGTLEALDKEGVGLIDREPREGLSGMIGFLHPKSTGGVLVELVDSETARR